MLVRTPKSTAFVSRSPVGLPTPLVIAQASGEFNGTYMRPNSGNTGATPAGGPYSASPDIWFSGSTPIANYQTALATDSSYATSSDNNIYSGQTNIIYVRGKNGATSDKTNTVQLYYAPSGIINSPSQWQNNVIKTDSGGTYGNISGLAPGIVGVCDATFLWTNVTPPPPGSDHYCVFAQFNDANNSNPFPSVDTALDMGALIMNNLGWGWRNTSMISATPGWQYTVPLNIPSDYPTTNAYSIYISPTGYVGWDAEFYSSRTDSQGNPIKLGRTKITQDGILMGVASAILDPGYESLMTINLYSPNGQRPPSGASVPMTVNYVAGKQSFLEAVSRNLIDAEFMLRLRRCCPEAVGIGPTAWITQGTYNWKITNNPAVK
jgi:hypothetical protein